MYTYDVEYFKRVFERNFIYIRTFMRNVERYRNKVALIDAEKDKKWTYETLNYEVNKLANALLKNNVKSGDVIVYQLINVPEFAFIYLASQKIGAINSPINFRLSSGEIAYILDDSKPSVFIFQAPLCETVKKALELSQHKPEILIYVGDEVCDLGISYDEFTKNQNLSEPEELSYDTWAEVTRLYTSGTTGRPKGIPLNNINEILSCLDIIIYLGLNKQDILLNLSPWFHRGGIHLGGPGPGLFLGATIVAMKTFSPKKALEIIEKYKITFTVGVPSMYKLLIEEQKKHSYNISSLRGALSMGAPLDRSLCIEMKEILTPNIFNAYGTSETFINTLLVPEDLPEKAGTAGRNITFFADVRVVKVYQDKLAEPDELVEKNNQEVGEVIMRSLTGPYDYYNKPQERAKRVYKDWFYSGDLATWDEEGYLTIVSRKDDMIIVGGENIYPVQIEEAIQEHPKVLQCAVVGVPDELRGQALVAYVVRKDESLTLEELKEFVNKHPMISPHKRPRYWVFVDELPMTATGKKQHYKLREKVLEDLKKGILMR
ncbi:MAG: AMP-dependent synthetase [Thermodesulfobacterium geofontis]|uniref:AMP-dependent synthetase n=3 Tax=Thermodesulfobacterium geofontis TaxID=1295609 RepID=A0A2N7PPB6_9BACT|nr:MAG: AMP-dependent synthetase [Thermodesulfobacterium geofontis]